MILGRRYIYFWLLSDSGLIDGMRITQRSRAATGVVVLSLSLSISLLAIEQAG